MSKALGSEMPSWKRLKRFMCISLFWILDYMMAERHLFLKKWWLIVRNILELWPWQCQRLFKYSRVILFSFFHSRISTINNYHSLLLTLSCLPSYILFFQMNLNSNLPIFFVTFLVEAFFSVASWADSVEASFRVVLLSFES